MSRLLPLVLLLACTDAPTETLDCASPTWSAAGELSPIEDAAAVVTGTDALLVGGIDAGLATLDNVLSRGADWDSIGTLPNPSASHGLHTDGDAVHVLGGYRFTDTAAEVYQRILRSTDGGRTWSDDGVLPSPLTDFGFVPWDETGGILIGGTESITEYRPRAAVTRAERTDDGWTFTPLSPLPVGLSHAAVARLGDRVLVAGGFNAGIPSDQVYVMLEDGSWTTATTLPVGFSSASMVTLGDRVYLLGGTNAGGQTRAAVLVGEGDPLTFTAGEPLPEGRSGGMAWVEDGAVHYGGGRDPSLTMRGDVWRLGCPE